MVKIIITRKLLRPPLTDAILKAIGSLAAESAYMESAIELGIWGLLKLDRDQGLLITTPLGFDARANLFSALAHDGRFNVMTEVWVEAQTEEMRFYYGRRNKFVHGYWLPGTEEDSATAASSRYDKGKLRLRSEEVTADTIQKDADAVCVLTHDFLDFLNANDALPPPSPNKPAKPPLTRDKSLARERVKREMLQRLRSRLRPSKA